MAKLNMAVKLTASRQSTQSTPIDVMRYILPVIIAATSLYVWFSPFLGPSDSYRSGDSIHPLSPSTSLQPSGLIGDSICEYHTLNQIDEQLRPDLRALIHTPFFSHYKVNLHKQCPFWDVHGLCTQRECAVEILGEDQIPEELTSKRSSTDVSTISFGIQSVQKQDYSDEDFCIVEDVDSSDSIYVSLVSNPERFTGFSGESANKIWRLIYEESCFKDWNTCLEKRAFYRIISGLHGSISMHICDEFCNVTTNKWGRNMLCYHYRVGKFPERIENVYFNYAILLSAINKMSMYFHTYDFCIANKQMEHCTKVHNY
ncbi:endoplasmic oxidoreductin-1 [Basidiobolus ranarum]|uniref:Endoplasmic oxidoreductin-1 n=1 Tax=Basidiobolus ranarum TaxID=34480 RepID=A0ABR2W0H6_9FUNG